LRLTHLKLAGFKSFVDPTTLHIHGQRVGIVGPNGCGKSNVMESVRWVLGESSAKEMRGDSMDAVIFNGSSNRKAIARASVELVFDNSLGSVGGAWAQYAEISVKRVIERDKGSTYLINNTVVRRRDVADLFLGTGLGKNSYAIIGQNTISRIVEAKPDELRVFLEEAAGISKYKERRRETELRLRDTLDNLQRVQDILQEIDKQISRLDAQAIVANQYHALQSQLKTTQARLWLVNKRDAASLWEKAQRHVEKISNDLEAQTATLRKTESHLEELRQQHFDHSEQVQQAQAAYYESNAVLANLETQIKHHNEARDRLIMQQEQANQQLAQLANGLDTLKNDLEQAQAQMLKSKQEEQQASEVWQNKQALLPELTNKLQQYETEFQLAQQRHLDCESSLKLECLNQQHLQNQLHQFEQRLSMLAQESQQIKLPEQDKIEALKQAQVQISQQIEQIQQQIMSLQQQQTALQNTINTERAHQTDLDKSLMQQHAQINSLEKLIQRLGQEQNMSDWLDQRKLANAPRIWQLLEIEAGWELAVEAVLAHLLNALVTQHVDKNVLRQRPPASITFANTSIQASKFNQLKGFQSLNNLVSVKDSALKPLIEDVLNDVYVDDGEWEIESLQGKLLPNQKIVNKQGDILTRQSITLNATAGKSHGILERQAELRQLNAKLPSLEREVKAQQDKLQQHDANALALNEKIQQLTQQVNQLIQDKHAINIELQASLQALQHMQQRSQAIQNEQLSISQQCQQLESQLTEKQSKIESLTLQAPDLVKQADNTKALLIEAQQSMQVFNSALAQEDKLVQEKQFESKINQNKLLEIERRITHGQEEKERLNRQLQEINTMLNAAKMDGLQQNLEKAVADKHAKEQALILVRETMAQLEISLQERERFRIQIEQVIHPMRDKLEQARLQEQETRLNFDRCQLQLNELAVPEQVLLDGFDLVNAKSTSLESQITSVQAQIDLLGAVNLAAIQELDAEKQRKQYLDSQADDLNQAIQTLQEAIFKIDKETRTRLQSTYDEANHHFGALFRDLFGGGQAKLELLGTEILDSGVQVFAQPPGKKNSTIHLLSGGEKALTALALVFALFKLNPAPFCLMDEVDAPLDDSNTDRFCEMVKKMSERTQFLFVSHNKITMEMAQQLVGVTMQESGVSRVVEVDMDAAVKMQESTYA